MSAHDWAAVLLLIAALLIWIGVGWLDEGDK